MGGEEEAPEREEEGWTWTSRKGVWIQGSLTLPSSSPKPNPTITKIKREKGKKTNTRFENIIFSVKEFKISSECRRI